MGSLRNPGVPVPGSKTTVERLRLRRETSFPKLELRECVLPWK